MSYILEALKKAQAERQLGSAPTIHAPQPAVVPDAARAGKSRALLLGLGGGALVVAAGALFLWRSGHGGVRPAAAPVAMAPSPAAAPVRTPALAPAGTLDTLPVSAPPAPPAPVRTATRPAEDAPRAAAAVTAKTEAPPKPDAPAPQAAVAQAPAQPQPQPQPQSQPPVTAPEDSLPFLQQLPAAQQQQVPRVAFGGYMYSSNPADRLLLVDKTLRHEGEEVAPGLVLEKLLPKAAVMNFRGVRYRVAY
jgi:general secretion pathway protein B